MKPNDIQDEEPELIEEIIDDADEPEVVYIINDDDDDIDISQADVVAADGYTVFDISDDDVCGDMFMGENDIQVIDIE